MVFENPQIIYGVICNAKKVMKSFGINVDTMNNDEFIDAFYDFSRNKDIKNYFLCHHDFKEVVIHKSKVNKEGYTLASDDPDEYFIYGVALSGDLFETFTINKEELKDTLDFSVVKDFVVEGFEVPKMYFYNHDCLCCS